MSEPERNMTRRSAGRIHVARGLWYVRPGVVELRPAPLPPLEPGKVQIRATYSGVSRGTERLVLAGLVPEFERERMRAPLQEGSFPFPVKYGYCAVGIVEAGPKELVGRNVFCLHPHQDVFQAPASMAVPIRILRWTLELLRPRFPHGRRPFTRPKPLAIAGQCLGHTRRPRAWDGGAKGGLASLRNAVR